MPSNLKVALVQHACADNVSSNIEHILSGIRDAHLQGANLVLLQELHNTRYFCQTENPDYFELAESVPGPTSKLLSGLAAELQIVIIASLFEKRSPGLYHNTAFVFDTDGSLAGRYRKMHIPDDPGYYEKFYFTPGDLGFKPVQTSLGKLGILVCWDQWFPEAARLLALAGAELILIPTAIGWDPADDSAEQQRQKDAWQLVQRGHAVANGIPLVCCNRTGIEQTADHSSTIRFWGSSFIAGPQGEILAEASIDNDVVLTATLDIHRSETVRRIWPFLRDRRIDAYADMMQRYLDEPDQ
jgi:N-carbamoylputrescine amidase